MYEVDEIERDGEYDVPLEIDEEEEEVSEGLAYNEVEIDNSKYSAGNKQWLVKGNKFFPCGETVSLLPSGYYNIAYDRASSQYFLKKKDIISEEILTLPDNKFQNIIDDITRFWDSRELYAKYKSVYKRGILLYGPPGGGKSSLIFLLCRSLIDKYNGIVINIKDENDIEDFNEIIPIIREIQKDTPVIIMIEDVDNFVHDDRSITTKLLNILDGNMQVDNMVTIATTNYPEKLAERISNRPSRFDRRYEVSVPDAKIRKFYLEKKIPKKEIKKNKIDIDYWVKQTRGLTISHLKEIVISVLVLKYEFNSALREMKEMMDQKLVATPVKRTVGVGFGRNDDEID